jgi:hypothetical protein
MHLRSKEGVMFVRFRVGATGTIYTTYPDDVRGGFRMTGREGGGVWCGYSVEAGSQS